MIRAIDVDGVLADFNTAFCQLIRDDTKVDVPEVSDSYPDEWDYHKRLGLSAKQKANLWDVCKNTDFFRMLDPLPEGIKALDQLNHSRNKGDSIYFVTSRCGNRAKAITEDWLEHWGYANPTVIVAEAKGLICKGLNVDMFVDDKPEHCYDVAFAVAKAKVFLIDRPYNRVKLPPSFHIIRIKSVLDPRITGEAE